jgi:hypothetical protein
MNPRTIQIHRHGNGTRRKPENGAGGNRTPVPGQSARRLYACSGWFVLLRRGEHSHPLRRPSSRCCLAPAPESDGPAPARCRRSAPQRASGADRRGHSGRESERRFASYFGACFLRGQHAPRRATTARSLSGRNQFGPGMPKNAGFYGGSVRASGPARTRHEGTRPATGSMSVQGSRSKNDDAFARGDGDEGAEGRLAAANEGQAVGCRLARTSPCGRPPGADESELTFPGGASPRRSGPRKSLRKEVIQPQVLLRLPCYDFVPVTELAVGTTEPWRLQALSAPMT